MNVARPAGSRNQPAGAADWANALGQTIPTGGRVIWPLLLAAAGASVIASPPATAIARLFFLAILGGGLVAAARLAGAAAQTIAAAALLALVLLQRWDVRTVTAPPDSLWVTSLTRPAERIQHTIALPLGQQQWEQLWRRAARADVWVCARGPLQPEDGLQLSLNGELLGTIVEANSSAPRPQPTSVGFFRLPVSRAQLERQPLATIEVRRAPDATARPVDVCGTFTYRPTAGRESSTLFDGARWLNPGALRGGRYTVELRFEDAQGRLFHSLY